MPAAAEACPGGIHAATVTATVATTTFPHPRWGRLGPPSAEIWRLSCALICSTHKPDRGLPSATAASGVHSCALAQHPGSGLDPVSGPRLGKPLPLRAGPGRRLRPLPPGLTWRNSVDGPEENVMRIAGNNEFVEPNTGRPRIYFKNTETHWWDSSQLYGDVLTKTKKLREGPKIRLDGGYLPLDVNGFRGDWLQPELVAGSVGYAPSFRARAQCAVRRTAPCLSRLERRAGLPDRATDCGGADRKDPHYRMDPSDPRHPLAGNRHEYQLERAARQSMGDTGEGLWLIDAHSLNGIPKSTPDHHAAPYSLTEDFVTVYRMHPLVPDDYVFFDHQTGRKLFDTTFLDIQGSNTDRVMREQGLANVLYAFGTAYPGAITLHNFPNSLMKFERDGEIVDLSVIDLVRTRRRGVPRYNDFRAGLHKPRLRRWEDLTADPEVVRLLKTIYKDIDLVDTMVGLFGETPTEGFGFSDTAFKIFILMASRRLQSDRFLNVDFRPEVYSPWVWTGSRTTA